MVEWGRCPIDGVGRFNLGVFVATASWTGEGQVLWNRLTSTTDRQDVFYRKRLRSKGRWALAVLATTSGPFGDQLSLFCPDAGFRHSRED